MYKGTITTNIFKNDPAFSGWYPAWLLQMINKGIHKISSETVTNDVTREVCWTSSNLEASYRQHASDMVKSCIDDFNTSYDNTV